MEETPVGIGQKSVSSATRRLLCYYGDDFTGSTDVLESLFRTGLRTVLFLKPPSPELLERFQDVACIGVAGVGRSLTPEEMETELRPILTTLRAVGAAIVHYKVCSTFDSSPGTGNIGKAAEIGRDIFGGRFIPLLVGVPYLGRYTLFGNHFAKGGGNVHRLDRHPTMSQHPVTPMAESDLRWHLAKQTALRTAHLDILALDGSDVEVRSRLERVIRQEKPDLLLFDVLDERRLETAGRLIWGEAAERQEGLFVIGSSGVEYALGEVWRQALGISVGARAEPPIRAMSQVSPSPLLVISGSCSPVTEDQIQYALQAGFVGIRVPMIELILSETREAARKKLQLEAQQWLSQGKHVMIYSATGPSDESIEAVRKELAAEGIRAEDSSRLLGVALGSLAKELVRQVGIKRILIAGGDTSGYVTRELGVYAIECIAALDPGGPLCRAYAEDPQFEGLELVLKGGQVGTMDFFEKVAGYR